MQNNWVYFTKRAFLSPTRGAYVESDGSLRLTYAELNNRCNQLANSFVAAGIAKGDRVGLLLMNSVNSWRLLRAGKNRCGRGAIELAIGCR